MTGERPNSSDLFSRSRRGFIATAVAGLAATALSANPFHILPEQPARIRAIAFDAFAIFNMENVFAAAGKIFPGKGAELINTCRAKQFEYSWLRTSGGQYKDFWKITEDALAFAAAKTGVKLTMDARSMLMEQYLSLSVWPDVLSALQVLEQKEIRLFFLSNLTAEMLEANLRNSKLEHYFESAISTGSAKAYKPAPAGYQLGVDKIKLKKEEILFVAFAGWDAAGSRWFGYPTFWLNRMGSVPEELDAIPDGAGKNMEELLNFIQH